MRPSSEPSSVEEQGAVEAQGGDAQQDRPDGEHWTVETRKPGLSGVCLLAVDGKLEHA